MKLLTRLRSFFRRLAHRRSADLDLDAEVRAHLDLLTEEKLREGMPAPEARRAARIELGGLEQVKEEVRASRSGFWIEQVWQDVRHALRNMRKDWRFAFVAIFALALGIGASTVVFSVFYNLLFHAFAAKDANRLVVPVMQNEEIAGQSGGNLESLDLYLADLDVIRGQNHVFENIVGYITAGGIVLASDGPRMYQFFDARVTSDAFEFYGVPPLLGRAITPEDGKPGAPPVFVMSYATWKDAFQGDAKILGKSLTVDGEPRTLVGVMPPHFQAFGPQSQIWIPITRTSGTPRTKGEFSPQVLARLKRGVSLEAASADLDVIVKRLALLRPGDFPKHFTVRVQSATDYMLESQGHIPVFHSDIKHLLYDLLTAVAMLLLIACSNVANLLLARASVREKEMAVRSALGATRGRLVRQLLAESSVLATAACVVGCIFAWFGVKFVPAIIPRAGDVYGGGSLGGETGVGLNPPVLLFAVGLALFTTLVCGLAPALRVARADLQPQLAGTGKGVNGGFRHGRFRAGLVIGEVALSIVLLIGAGLMMRSFYLLTHVELGFNPKNVLMVVFLPPPSHGMTPAPQRFASPEGQVILREVVERLKTLPGVAQVSVEDTIPGYGPTRGLEVTVPGTAHSKETGL
ncbi:MAG TPA: ABC transporter permease, partial [Patescibacteria group bacterium]|nr:ABC transporter permease [Patescibacteria group bacterium]